MGKRTKLPLLILLIVATFLSITTPSFGQTGSAEESGDVQLSFTGSLNTTAGSIQEVTSDTIRFEVPEGTQGVIDLIATRSATEADSVTIAKLSLPYGWPDFSTVQGLNNVAAQYTFTVPVGSAGSRFQLQFQASTPGVGTGVLTFILDVVPPEPEIEVSPTSLDFGEIAIDTTAERELTIKNVGDADLWVGNVAIKGGASSPFDLCGIVWTACPLPPGESFKRTVCFSPKTAGLFKDEVLINSGGPTTVTIPVQGNATKKKSTISCTAMGRPKPGSVAYHHGGVREAEVIVTVEISPPHFAVYAVDISDANGGTHGPFTYNTDANGKDKRLLVVNGTLLNDKLQGTWKCEVSWKGDEEYEGASSQCAFNVSELGSYEGTEAGPTTTSPTRASNRIDINYDGFCTINCSKIVFIQVCSDEVFFTDRSRRALKPSGTGARFAYMDNDAVNVDRVWFTVDYLKTENDPYYNGGDAADHGVQGVHNTTQTTLANIYDKPSYNMTEINNIFLVAYNKTVLKIMTEFETFAFCVNGTDKGKFYEGIKWRYEQDQAGSKNSTSIQVVSEPSEGFKKALDKWCTNHGFTLPKPK